MTKYKINMSNKKKVEKIAAPESNGVPVINIPVPETTLTVKKPTIQIKSKPRVTKPKPPEFNTFFHAVNSGDMIASMAGMQHLWKKKKKKNIIYQRINMFGNYAMGYTHPLVNDNNPQELVTMNQKMFDMLRPLVLAQPYMEDLRVASGEKVDFDLHRIHAGVRVNMPWGQIQRWTWYVFPELACNLANPWIFVEPNDDINVSGVNKKHKRELKDCMIINFTERYRDTKMEYHFLRSYQNRLVFAGTEKEYRLFTSQWNLDVPYLQVNDFLELAQAIRGAKGLLGNASMCFNIAEAMKTPRILEVCPSAQNVIPVGENAFDFQFLGSAEYFVDQILNMNSPNRLCPVCGKENVPIINKRDKNYFHCPGCDTIYSTVIDQANVVPCPTTNINSLATKIHAMGVGSVLDYGCGDGSLVKELTALRIQALAYDKFIPDFGEFPNGVPFDMITMIHVLEHITWPFAELNQIFESLVTGGYLYIETYLSDGMTMEDPLIDPSAGRCTFLSSDALNVLMTAHGFVLHESPDKNTRIYRKV